MATDHSPVVGSSSEGPQIADEELGEVLLSCLSAASFAGCYWAEDAG